MCEAITRGTRHDQGNHMGCEACVRQLQGVQGMCEAATLGVWGNYKGCKACARHLQLV